MRDNTQAGLQTGSMNYERFLLNTVFEERVPDNINITETPEDAYWDITGHPI